MTSKRAKEPRLVRVIDFGKGEVRMVTPDEAKRESDEMCRSQGHYFGTNSERPRSDSRCMCGDITFAEWGSR